MNSTNEYAGMRTFVLRGAKTPIIWCHVFCSIALSAAGIVVLPALCLIRECPGQIDHDVDAALTDRVLKVCLVSNQSNQMEWELREVRSLGRISDDHEGAIDVVYVRMILVDQPAHRGSHEVLLLHTNGDVIARLSPFVVETLSYDGRVLLINKLLPIPLASVGDAVALEGICYDDLVSRLDPATYARDVVQLLMEKLVRRGRTDVLATSLRKVLAEHLEQYEYAQLSETEPISLWTTNRDAIMAKIPENVDAFEVASITSADVVVLEAEFLRYWECKVSAIVQGHSKGAEQSAVIRFVVSGGPRDRDRIENVRVVGVDTRFTK